MTEEILVPSFSLGEPNMASARRKNDARLCAMHLCDNRLGDPPDLGFLGVKICPECRKSIDESLRKMDAESTRETAEFLSSLVSWEG